MEHWPHYRRRALGASALLACLLAIGGGCSVSIGDNTLDTDELEREIGNTIREQLDRTGVSVDCPTDVDADKGDVFRCTLTTPDGEEREVLVRQTDDEGNVRWEVVGS